MGISFYAKMEVPIPYMFGLFFRILEFPFIIYTKEVKETQSPEPHFYNVESISEAPAPAQAPRASRARELVVGFCFWTVRQKNMLMYHDVSFDFT